MVVESLNYYCEFKVERLKASNNTILFLGLKSFLLIVILFQQTGIKNM